MKVTTNLKEKVRAAQAAGYENVFCTLGKFKATTYVTFHSIEKILESPIGTDLTYRHYGPWRGCANDRMVGPKDIQYSRLFEKF